MNEKIFRKRLKELKGSSDLKTFATRCGVDANTIRPYLEGETDGLPTLKTLLKITESNNVKVGWLIGEDHDDGLPPNFIGLNIETHIEIGEELKRISETLNKLYVEFDHAYPTEGHWARPAKHLYNAWQEILEARHFAEENLYNEHSGLADSHVYYGYRNKSKVEKKYAGNDN